MSFTVFSLVLAVGRENGTFHHMYKKTFFTRTLLLTNNNLCFYHESKNIVVLEKPAGESEKHITDNIPVE